MINDEAAAGQCKTQIVDCRLQSRGKIQTNGKMKTADFLSIQLSSL